MCESPSPSAWACIFSGSYLVLLNTYHASCMIIVDHDMVWTCIIIIIIFREISFRRYYGFIIAAATYLLCQRGKLLVDFNYVLKILTHPLVIQTSLTSLTLDIVSSAIMATIRLSHFVKKLCFRLICNNFRSICPIVLKLYTGLKYQKLQNLSMTR